MISLMHWKIWNRVITQQLMRAAMIQSIFQIPSLTWNRSTSASKKSMMKSLENMKKCSKLTEIPIWSDLTTADWTLVIKSLSFCHATLNTSMTSNKLTRQWRASSCKLTNNGCEIVRNVPSLWLENHCIHI